MKIYTNICILTVFLFILMNNIEASEYAIEEWVARYNGNHGSDEARAIAVDHLGNVYVTGDSLGGRYGYDDDYATVKYYPDGSELWVARYNGPHAEDDLATSIAVNDYGHVYVTGASYIDADRSDYVTIKYNAEGIELWMVRYDRFSWDFATSICLDEFENVYVTGYSGTIKYDEEGNELWDNDCGGSELVIDNDGYLYVMGPKYDTFKLDNEGNIIWDNKYIGPGNGSDFSRAFTIDDDGNVYVTGQSDGNDTGFDYATVKYNADGDELWVRRHHGAGNIYDIAWDIANDGLGNIYVTGESDADGTDLDYTTIKYDSYGNELWVSRYNGLGNDNDEAYSIAIDNSSNVYVTGGSKGIHGGYDYVTVKYSPDGEECWIARYSGSIANAITVDDLGNVYVTGGSGNGDDYDYVTIKYVQGGSPDDDDDDSDTSEDDDDDQGCGCGM